MQGEFTLTIQKALLTHDTDTLASMDPYVKIIYNNKAFCT